MQHKFVDYIPEDLSEGVIYISMQFATAVHKCCCGCGQEVVTPITPKDWQLAFNGETVTLHPSIGNWSFKCKSHYFIRNNEIKWCGAWTKQQVEAGKSRDMALKQKKYGQPSKNGILRKIWNKAKQLLG